MRLHLLLLGLATSSLANAHNIIVTGTGAGSPGIVSVDFDFDYHTGGVTHGSQFMPYAASYTGGVRVAMGDVNGDGAPEIITGTMDSTSHVKVFDLGGHELMSFLAYSPSFTGGVYVAAGDLDGDGRADIITGARAGGAPHVKVFSGATGAELSSFFAFDAAFTGGVRVAAGDVDGDGRADLVAGAGPSAGPHVKVFDGRDFSTRFSFDAYDPTFLGGVNVAAGDVNGDGFADIVTGAGSGATPHVKVFSGQTGSEFLSFEAFDRSFTGGVNIAVGDIDGDGKAEIFAGAGDDQAAAGPYRLFGDSNGDAIGIYQTNGASIAVSSVPEPGSIAVLAIGLAVLARRRKQR